MSQPKRYATGLSNDLWLPAEALAVREEARRFADNVLKPLAHGLNTTPEKREGFRHDVVQAIANAGLYEIPFSTDVGGRGLRYPTLATLLVMEELGYYSPGAASAFYDGQAILCGQTLNNASDKIRQAYIPPLIKGEIVCCFATSEPDTSTDLSVSAMQTTAKRVEGGYVVNGRKRWITNSVAGDIVLLLCKTGNTLTMLIVDMHSEGVKVFDPDLKMGNHAQLTADIELSNVFVPEANRVGEEGAGLRVALGSLMIGRAGIAALGVGMAQRAFDFSANYICEREVFGKPIAAFQHWQFTYADHAIAIENARNLYQKAAMIHDKGEPSLPLMAMAKVSGSEVAVNMSRDAIQACGGYGFARTMTSDNVDWPLEAIYRDAKIGEIYEGANEVQRWAVAREIFGRGVTG
ncbi:acyl-CoA dehydrogenase [Gammaproteobacteria bacterium 45_16_T64]|nr:acyl-CoA dehydrogenase [Gammaproteobacteria bacterium 45_16_T64]